MKNDFISPAKCKKILEVVKIIVKSSLNEFIFGILQVVILRPKFLNFVKFVSGIFFSFPQENNERLFAM